MAKKLEKWQLFGFLSPNIQENQRMELQFVLPLWGRIVKNERCEAQMFLAQDGIAPV